MQHAKWNSQGEGERRDDTVRVVSVGSHASFNTAPLPVGGTIAVFALSVLMDGDVQVLTLTKSFDR